jgi:hypothetical protein
MDNMLFSNMTLNPNRSTSTGNKDFDKLRPGWRGAKWQTTPDFQEMADKARQAANSQNKHSATLNRP